MRTSHFTAALALAVASAPSLAAAWVVVRAPIYVAPRPVVMVAPPPVYVAPPPVYVAPPAPPPPPLTTKLPLDTRLSILPSGCTEVWLKDNQYFVCGGNWLKGSDSGPYYKVVPAPQ